MLCGCGATRAADPRPQPPNNLCDGADLDLDLGQLESLLSDGMGRAYLRSFAHANMCDESVSCVLKLRDLRASGSFEGPCSISAAKNFADEYLRDSTRNHARHFVEDVPERLRRSLLNALESSEETLSTRAKSLLLQTNTAVSNFIKADILIRFRSSTHYRELLAIHPRRLLRVRTVTEAFARSLHDPVERSALAFYLEADDLAERHDALTARASCFISDGCAAALAAATEAGSLSLVNAKAEALQSLTDAYLAFLLSSEGRSLIYDSIGTMQSCLDPPMDPPAAQREATLDKSVVSGSLDDYSAGW